jgi:hypothetical protein
LVCCLATPAVLLLLQAFFTKVPPTVTDHQLIQLFTACGDVVHVELFTPWPGAKISKGCGLVEFAQPEAAAAAVASLHQAFTWPHSHSPLVVEWLDAKRQAANRANKLIKQGSGDSSTHMRRTAAAAAAAAEPAAHASHSAHLVGVPGQMGMQQQYSSRSCPLPRLQPQQLPGGWVQPGWAGAGGAQQGVAYARSSIVPQVQQLQPQLTASYAYQQQQQQGDLSGAGRYWWPLQSVSGAVSCYDTSSGLGMTAGSTMSTISTSSSLVAPITSADLSTGSLTCCSVGSPAMCIPGADMLPQQQQQQQQCHPETLQAYAGSGCQSPIGTAEPSLVMPGGGNLMLLQPMLDEVQGQAMYMLGGSSGMVQMGAAAAAAAGSYAGGSLALQPPQYQQLAAAQTSSALYAAAAGAAASKPAKQQQQQWWAHQQACSQPLQQQQQQQQAAVRGEAMMVLPLSGRQLAGMSAVLPEVPRLTGAKAYISADCGGRGVALVLTGRAGEVSAAHSVTALMLGNMGVEEPLQCTGLQP